MEKEKRNAGSELRELWAGMDLPADQLNHTALTGADEVLPSSFCVTRAAQSSIAAAGSAAGLIAGQRADTSFDVTVDSLSAALECTSHFTIDGNTPPQWAEYSGLYRTNDGHIRIHGNFDHHRDSFLKAIDLVDAPSRQAAESKVSLASSVDLENDILALGGACAALRTQDEWDALPQAAAIKALPLIGIRKINDAAPRQLPAFDKSTGALGGVRVLDLTRILAGPVCGRTLAAYGADVMLVNSPHLPNIDHIIDTSRGKLSTHCDLTTPAGRNALESLLTGAHIFVQGYRPGALAGLGFEAEALCERHPGLIAVSLSAYGNAGPWQARRGFDSLVQTATGFNIAEATAFEQQQPKPLPVQILDYATGFLMAFGAQAALYKQQTEGGSYHVELSLARTALWLKEMGQSKEHLDIETPDLPAFLQACESSYGKLMALPHAAVFNDLPNHYRRPSVPPGTHRAAWPDT